jgi:uracil-DNA glycosylase
VGDIVYFPMFHPAAALHQPRFRSFIETDILKIPEILASLETIEPSPEDDKPATPQQLSLL